MMTTVLKHDTANMWKTMGDAVEAAASRGQPVQRTPSPESWLGYLLARRFCTRRHRRCRRNRSGLCYRRPFSTRVFLCQLCHNHPHLFPSEYGVSCMKKITNLGVWRIPVIAREVLKNCRIRKNSWAVLAVSKAPQKRMQETEPLMTHRRDPSQFLTHVLAHCPRNHKR